MAVEIASIENPCFPAQLHQQSDEFKMTERHNLSAMKYEDTFRHIKNKTIAAISAHIFLSKKQDTIIVQWNISDINIVTVIYISSLS